MVEKKDEETLPPEVKKDLLKEGWMPPEAGSEDILKGGEDQEKQSPEASSEAIEARDEDDSKDVEKPALSSRESKDLAESLLKEGYATKVVEDKTGLSAPVVRGLKGALVKRTKKLKEEEKKPEEKETKKLEEKDKPLVPYAEMGEPEDFLRGFLEGYEFKNKFIDLLCRRVVLRDELPHPNDLAADLLSMEGSGVKSARNANAIAEDYGYALKKYLGEMGEQNRPHMGYDMRPSESPGNYGGIYTSRYEDHERPRQGRGISMREPQHDGGEEDRHDRHDMDQPVTMKDLLLWQKEQELQHLREDDGRKRRRDDVPDWMQDRMDKLEEKLHQRDEERMQRLEDELKAARSTPPPPGPAGVSRDDVAGIVENIFDARSKKVTMEDVQKVIRDQTADFRVGLTKDDLDYLKAKDQFRLEERKLDEKGKTRDELANIARSGFSQMGQMVARTLTEAGATTGISTKGMADQTGTVLQVNCPGCGAAITAPITENTITCPQCGRSYTVERPANETLPPPSPPVSTDASFSVEPPPIPTEPTLPVETPMEKSGEEFTPKEKEKIENSLEDAREGRITPLKVEESAIPEHYSGERDLEKKKGIEKIAENLAIGAGVKKLEEELKKEKKPIPPIMSNICPICGKKLKSKTGVRLHIREKHPEYE